MKKTFLKLFRQNKFIVLSSIIERIFFFLIFLFIARQFPTEIYGQLVTIFSLANIFIILFDFGLPALMQKNLSGKLSGQKDQHSQFFNDAVLINILIFPLYISIVTICSVIFYPELSLALVIVTVVSVYIFSIGNILNKALYGLNDYRVPYTALLFSRITCLIIFAGCLYLFKTPLQSLVAVLIFAGLIQILILSKYLKARRMVVSFKTFNVSKVFNILKISFPLGLAVIFNFLYDKIDIILISKLSGFDGVAFYNAGYGIFKASTLSFSFLFVTGLTRVSYLSKNSRGVKLFFIKYSVILLYICIAVTAILFFGADYFVKFIYTEKFIESVLVLKILSFATLGLALNNLTGIILTGAGLYKMNMIVTLSGLIINVILNIIFIPRYGIAAAAVITLITEYLIFAGGYFFIRKILNI